MRMNSGIILQGQQPDIVGSAARGFEAGRRNRLADIYNQHGAGIASGDQNAMNALAQFDPTAAMEAQRGHQIMQHADSQEGRLNREEQRIIEAEAAKMDAEQRAAEAKKIEEAVKMGLALPDATAWDQTMSQMQPELVGQFDNRQMLANRFLSVAEVLKGIQGPEYTQITGEDAAAAGLDPAKVYNVGRDGKISSIGGGVNVSVNNVPEVGTIPQGYQLVTDPVTGARSLQVLPGGPEDQTEKLKEGNILAARAGRVVIEDIDRLKSAVENAPWYSPAVGLGAEYLSEVGGTNAADAKALATTIRSNVGFDRLQQMRDASPTGGALGQVSNLELANLQAVLGNLEQSQSEDQFLFNLDRLSEIYTEIMTKLAAYPNAAEFGFDQSRGHSEQNVSSDDAALFEKYGVK